MKKFIFFAFIIFLLVSTATMATADPPGSGWTMIFNDEFDSTSLDLSKWATARSDGGRDCSDAESWYVDDPAYHIVSNGTLKLVAKKVQSQPGYPYSTGAISAHNSFNQIYGYWEGRMKIPKGQGFWPAFWLMPKSSNNSWLWPPEIDIFENLGVIQV